MYSVVFIFVCSLFFFFKQKTAYEMRISDWSSDVCSSDLIAAFRATGLQPIEHIGDQVADLAELRHAEAACGACGRADADAARLGGRQRIEGNAVLVAGDARMLQRLVGRLAGEAQRAQVEIGRAHV